MMHTEGLAYFSQSGLVIIHVAWQPSLTTLSGVTD